MPSSNQDPRFFTVFLVHPGNLRDSLSVEAQQLSCTYFPVNYLLIFPSSMLVTSSLIKQKYGKNLIISNFSKAYLHSNEAIQ
jgi:hypothetical protein